MSHFLSHNSQMNPQPSDKYTVSHQSTAQPQMRFGSDAQYRPAASDTYPSQQGLAEHLLVQRPHRDLPGMQGGLCKYYVTIHLRSSLRYRQGLHDTIGSTSSATHHSLRCSVVYAGFFNGSMPSNTPTMTQNQQRSAAMRYEFDANAVPFEPFPPIKTTTLSNLSNGQQSFPLPPDSVKSLAERPQEPPRSKGPGSQPTRRTGRPHTATRRSCNQAPGTRHPGWKNADASQGITMCLC